MRKTLCLLGGTLLLAGTAIAQDDGYDAQDAYGTEDAYQPEASETSAMTAGDTFAVIDTDADGSVTEDEFVSYAGDGSETQFASMAGDDGALSVDELESFMQQAPTTE